jgi:hypothetical protein
MGIPGAGKSRAAEELVASGYVRLNRDERAGTLRKLAAALDQLLAAGARRVVLDNTYLTRASRNDVVDVASRHGLPIRCVWLDTPLPQAQVNMVERLLARFGSLPTPEELRVASRDEPGLLTPTQQMRALRELEPPGEDEGFAAVERVPFARGGWRVREHAALFVAAASVDAPGWTDALPHDPGITLVCLFDWVAEGIRDLTGHAERLVARLHLPVETAACPHGGGPPKCWCRPPLPGLALAFSRAHGVDPSRSLLLGTSAAHRTLAATLGARYVTV